MSAQQIAARDAARPRFRSTVTTILLIMLAVLIVRDVVLRRRPPA